MIKNILICNCQGAADKVFVVHAEQLLASCHPDIIVLVETEVSKGRAANILADLGFNFFVTVEGHGRAGGIWIAWKNDSLRMTISEKNSQSCIFLSNQIESIGYLLLFM